MSDDKDQWKQTAGLAADSTVAQIVCKEPDKEEWDQEAEEKGYRSTSKYLYELVQEARAYRQQGYLAHHQSEEQIAQLKSRIKELETQLKRERKKESTTTKIDDIDFLEQFLHGVPDPSRDSAGYRGERCAGRLDSEAGRGRTLLSGLTGPRRIRTWSRLATRR